MTARDKRSSNGREPNLLEDAPKAGANSGATHDNVVVSEDQPPPDPRLRQLTRVMARLAARAWYASEGRG